MYDTEYFVVDMASCTSTGEIINSLSLALETLNHTGKKIVMKLNDSYLNQSQMLSIQSLITSYGCILDTIETVNEDTAKIAENMNLYVQKPIESLTDDDVNVRITGRLHDISTDRIIIRKCPHCGNNVDLADEENVCDFCGESYDEPRSIFLIPARLEDDTGDISITFFDKLAEELIGMKKEEIIELMEDGFGIEEKIEDLEGLTIEVIANVGFNEITEENRLNPKKILSKYY